MGKQIRLLTKISLCNLFGINEIRFTKDKKKKNRYVLLGVILGLLLAMLVVYVGSMSYGLIFFHMGHLVPAVLTLCVSLISFMFTMFKAGPVLFEKSAYEKQITLPVTIRAIIISRFLSMYVTNLLLSLIVMLPGMAVYGVMEKPPITFYVYGLIGCMFLSLLPLTIASVIGALVTGISSRWKRKNLVAIVLTMLFAGLVFIGSMRMSRMDESQLTDVMKNIVVLIETQIQSLYPPAIWLSAALVDGRGSFLLLFLFVSMGSFLLFLEILQPFYGKICSLLNANEAKRNYKMKKIHGKPVLQSMIERELRHYFSSTVYVTNTLIAEVLMVIVTVSILVMGKENIERLVGMNGIVERVLPIMLGTIPAMLPMSACSISMEGKQWWLMQTLPVTEKEVLRSKIWASLLVVFPFYLVSEILAFLALKPAGINAVCLFAIPVLYIVYGAKMGVVINGKFPIFDWDNETRVVKQSASSFLMSLVGGLSGMIPLAVLIYVQNIPAYVVYGVSTCVLLIVMGIVCSGKRQNLIGI